MAPPFDPNAPIPRSTAQGLHLPTSTGFGPFAVPSWTPQVATAASQQSIAQQDPVFAAGPAPRIAGIYPGPMRYGRTDPEWVPDTDPRAIIKGR